MTPILTGVIASGISGNLTPPWSPQGGYDALATVTVGATSVPTITFAGIPGDYKHLQVRLFAKYTGVGTGIMRFNTDAGSNYSIHNLHGNGVITDPVGSMGTANTTSYYYTGAAGTKDTTFNVAVIDIVDYADTTKFKTARGLYGWDNNGTGYIEFNSGNWRNLSAISSIDLTSSAGNFAQFSHIALYGVR